MQNSTTQKQLLWCVSFYSFFFSIEYICVCLTRSLNTFYILHILLNIMLWIFSHVSRKSLFNCSVVLSIILFCLFLFWCHVLCSLSFNIRNMVLWLLSSTVICMVFTSCLYLHWTNRTLIMQVKIEIALFWLSPLIWMRSFLCFCFFIHHFGV